MRLHGQVKMGYYPTPSAVVELVRGFLAFPTYAKAGALDPCCGEGLALEALAKGTSAITYGIELDAARAEEAKRRLARVIHAGYEDVEMPPESMGLLYLNPPYDDDEGERKELKFLRDTMETLVRDGALVYVIPRKRLTKDVALLLGANFSRLEVHRFPDGEYERFGQIVILGRRNAWPVDPEFPAAGLLESASEENLRALAAPSYPHCPIPPSPESLLHRREMPREALAKLVERSPLWERLKTIVEPPELGALPQPPTPLHVGHLGLLLAAGRLNGVVGTGPDRHIVAGKPEKHIVETADEEEDASGNRYSVHKRLESFRVAIKLLRPTGEVVKLV